MKARPTLIALVTWLKTSILISSVLLGLAPLTANANASFSSLVIFGDSISDTGNFASEVGNFPFPYYQNRVSNGPLAVEYLAQNYALSAAPSLHLIGQQSGLNYSVAGGSIDYAGPVNGTEDIQPQIDAHLQRVSNTIDPNTMLVMLAVGSDLFRIRRMSDQGAQTFINYLADTYIAHLQRLKNAGGRLFLVSNGPNIGIIPETIAMEAGTPGIAVRTSARVRSFNLTLANRLANFAKRENVKIWLFDSYAHLSQVVSNSASLGMPIATEGCVQGLPIFPSYHADCDSGNDFSKFVFFDAIHPSARVQQMVGQKLIQILQQGPTFQKAPNSSIVIAPILKLLLLDD